MAKTTLFYESVVAMLIDILSTSYFNSIAYQAVYDNWSFPYLSEHILK